MKVAFFSDTVLVKKINDYYGMTLNNDFIKKRYLKYFDEFVLCSRVVDKTNNNYNISGYKIVNDNYVKVLPIDEYNNLFDSIFNYRLIKKKIECIINNVDKVIIRMPSVIGFFAINICNKRNKKYLVEMVSCPWDGYLNHTNRLGIVIAPFMYLINKYYIKKSNKVLYVTSSFLQKRYPTKGISYSCSDVDLNGNDNDYVIRNFKLSQKKEILLLSVGNVSMRYKGHKYVIKALSKLPSKYKYYIVGNGNFDKLKKYAIKNKVYDRVIYFGSLEHCDVLKIMKKVDIYIQPSLQEGLPRALIEAMSVGCPALGSNVGGIIELLDSKFIFKKAKYQSIISKIKDLDEENLYDISLKNIKIAAKYDYKNLESIRENIYNNI